MFRPVERFHLFPTKSARPTEKGEGDAGLLCAKASQSATAGPSKAALKRARKKAASKAALAAAGAAASSAAQPPEAGGVAAAAALPQPAGRCVTSAAAAAAAVGAVGSADAEQEAAHSTGPADASGAASPAAGASAGCAALWEEAKHAAAPAAARRPGVVQDWMICNLTKDVLRDPVTMSDGHSYERPAAEAWLRKHQTSPLTGEVLASLTLITNHGLRNLVEALLKGKE